MESWVAHPDRDRKRARRLIKKAVRLTACSLFKAWRSRWAGMGIEIRTELGRGARGSWW
jgi:hypothetical protein